VDFVIIAFVVFMLARAFIPKDKEKEPETKECPQCLQIIPIAAKRCKACTQPVG
jgi:large conductance mechanosensitive channel